MICVFITNSESTFAFASIATHCAQISVSIFSVLQFFRTNYPSTFTSFVSIALCSSFCVAMILVLASFPFGSYCYIHSWIIAEMASNLIICLYALVSFLNDANSITRLNRHPLEANFIKIILLLLSIVILVSLICVSRVSFVLKRLTGDESAVAFWCGSFYAFGLHVCLRYFDKQLIGDEEAVRNQQFEIEVRYILFIPIFDLYLFPEYTYILK